LAPAGNDQRAHHLKKMIEVTCDATMLQQFAEGEAVQFKAMQEIQAKGVTIHKWPKASSEFSVAAHRSASSIVGFAALKHRA
jgi:hypothetical protein